MVQSASSVISNDHKTQIESENELLKRNTKKESSAEQKSQLKESDSDVHLPVTEIHLKSHEWFGDFITKHEVPRKAFHSSIGFITLYLYTLGVNYKHVRNPLAYAFVLLFILDTIRLHSDTINRIYCRCVGALMRKKEIHTYNGVLWYLLGLVFSFTFFSKDVAAMSVFLLSWSDTAASTFGRKYGHLTPKITKKKSLAGSLAAFAVGFLTCLGFYGYFIPRYSHLNTIYSNMWTPETSKLGVFGLSWLGGFVAALSEGIDIFNLDDNFTIPVLSSIFLHTVITLFKK